MNELLTVREVAERIGVSVITVRRHAEAGRLAGRKTSPRGRWRFTPADIDAWITSATPDREPPRPLTRAELAGI